MSLIYIQKVKVNQAAFEAKVRQISNLLGIDPNWLMIIMNFESGGTFNPAIVNPVGGATGLIQFMPATAKGLGTTTAALAKMSNVEQLNWVHKYYSLKAGKFKSGEDLYLYNFFITAVGKPDSFVIESKNLKASTIAKQNPAFDLNKDGQITVGEWRVALRKILTKLIKDKSILDMFFEKKNSDRRIF